MAHVKDIFGTGISGKLNQVVFYQRKGKTFVRALPVRRKKTVSPAVLLNKQRFGAMIRFAHLFRYVVIPQIWSLASRTLTGNQLFIKTNKGAFDPEGNIPDVKLVQLSTGKLQLPDGIVLKRMEEGSPSLLVHWDPDAGVGAARPGLHGHCPPPGTDCLPDDDDPDGHAHPRDRRLLGQAGML